MRKTIIAAVLCLGIGLATPLFALDSEVVILTYHSFLGSGTSSLDFSIAEFAKQLDDFSALGYHFVSMSDILSGSVTGRNNILVTIDDGNHSVAKAYTEVLAPRSIRPALFIYPSVIGRSKFSLTREVLRKLSDDGCDIAAHGFYHEYLTPKAFAANPAKCRIEIERPAKAIADITGKPVLTFGYPFGVGSPEAERLLADQGYTWAFLAGNTLAPVDFSSTSLDHYAVPRTIVYRWNIKFILASLAKRAEAAEAARATSKKPQI